MRKVLLFIFAIFNLNLFFISSSYATGVEEVFQDIDTNYKYYDELQELYDNGIIQVSGDNLFNSDDLLTRDDLIGIAEQSSCKQCLGNNVSSNLISKYYGVEIYFDLATINNNFYCIAQAKNDNIIEDYESGYICEDGTFDTGKIPFCSNNNVTKQEAIKILLNSSNIFTEEDNYIVEENIKQGNIAYSLSNDVDVFIEGDEINKYYGYLQKALKYSFVDKRINEEGDIIEQKYNLLEVDSEGNINPTQYITKGEFIKMAYIIFKKNNCNFDIESNANFPLGIEILDESCNINVENCFVAKKSKGKYDFSPKVSTECEEGIKNYTWVFNYLDSEKIVTYNKVITEKYIDNYEFTDDNGNTLSGEWNVLLNVEDNCGTTSQAEKTIYISSDKESDFNVFVTSEDTDLMVKTFSATVYGNVADLEYKWFIDNNAEPLTGRVVQNIFNDFGIHTINLIIIDKETKRRINDKFNIDLGNEILSEQMEEELDSDGDSISDDDDLCPLVVGVSENNGCPIFNKECSYDSDCLKGKMCDNGFCVLDSDSDKVPDSSDNCRLTYGLTSNSGCPDGAIGENCYVSEDISGVCGSATCSSCPCPNQVDFKADIRKCDLIFPTILSPDGADIYAKGQNTIIEN